MENLVSVIIPVYNVERFIRESLNSVLKQSHKNLEIIIVDDGSTDTCKSIVDEFAALDSRCIVIHQVNKGLSGARNSGLDIATGDYLFFLDSDDILDFFIIEKLLKAILQYDADISCCGTVFCNENGKLIKKECTDSVKIFKGKEQIYGLIKTKEIPTMAWGKLYKKQLFNNVRFPQGQVFEDVATIYKTLLASNNTVLINESLYWYRQVMNSISHKSFNIKKLDLLTSQKNREDDLVKQFPDLTPYFLCERVYVSLRIYYELISGYSKDTKLLQDTKNSIVNGIGHFLIRGNNSFSTKAFAVFACIFPSSFFIMIFKIKKYLSI